MKKPFPYQRATSMQASPYLPSTKPRDPFPMSRGKQTYGANNFGGMLDDFEVIGPIAQGAFSQVLRARERGDDKEVAIKCFNTKKLSESPEERKGMVRELKVLRVLGHDNIMKLHRRIDGTSSIFAIMEYLGGGSLKLVIGQQSKPFPETAAAPIVGQLSSALAHCHAHGVVHRDIKAANVLFADSSRTTVKLVDFGFALPAADPAKITSKCGTPSHMAPEVYMGKAYDGRRADVFALGVLAFEMLHLVLPFDAPNLEGLKMRIIKGHRKSTNSALSPAARGIINAMLTVDANGRPDAEKVCMHPWLLRGGQSKQAAEATGGGGLPAPQPVTPAVAC